MHAALTPLRHNGRTEGLNTRAKRTMRLGQAAVTAVPKSVRVRGLRNGGLATGPAQTGIHRTERRSPTTSRSRDSATRWTHACGGGRRQSPRTFRGCADGRTAAGRACRCPARLTPTLHILPLTTGVGSSAAVAQEAAGSLPPAVGEGKQIRVGAGVLRGGVLCGGVHQRADRMVDQQVAPDPGSLRWPSPPASAERAQ